MSRDKEIVRVSLIGIVTNLLLAAFKAAVGVFSHSIAIVLDAVNNTTDALSSIITIAGIKLAGRRADREHPYGHGRIEYISAVIVGAIVLYAGITSGVECVKKIIDPVETKYSVVTLVVMGVAIVVKLVLGSYVKAKGEKLKSGALVASGVDAFFDAVITASVLASAIIYMYTGYSFEAYVGVLISLVILKSGLEILKDTVADILGRRADASVSKKIKKILSGEEAVHGAYDLVINDYGPEKTLASVHLELPDKMTVAELDKLTRHLEEKVYKETGVILTGIGVYSYNTDDPEAAKVKQAILRIVMKYDWALQMHGFFLDKEKKEMRFDVVMSFDIKPEDGVEILMKELKEEYPDYKIDITPDVDITD